MLFLTVFWFRIAPPNLRLKTTGGWWKIFPIKESNWTPDSLMRLGIEVELSKVGGIILGRG